MAFLQTNLFSKIRCGPTVLHDYGAKMSSQECALMETVAEKVEERYLHHRSGGGGSVFSLGKSYEGSEV